MTVLLSSQVDSDSQGGSANLRWPVDVAGVAAAGHAHEISGLRTDILEAAGQAWRDGDGVPWFEYHVACTGRTPEDLPSSGERDEDFLCDVAVQRRRRASIATDNVEVEALGFERS